MDNRQKKKHHVRPISTYFHTKSKKGIEHCYIVISLLTRTPWFPGLRGVLRESWEKIGILQSISSQDAHGVLMPSSQQLPEVSRKAHSPSDADSEVALPALHYSSSDENAST